MVGYLGNPEATEQSFQNGWLKTGDVGYFQEGSFYIVDRVKVSQSFNPHRRTVHGLVKYSHQYTNVIDLIKDMIKVRGWQVAPSELESYLLTHPAILDVGVVGVSLPAPLGEVPSAYVVVKQPDHSNPVTEADVVAYLGERLSKVKALSGGVKFVDSIPRNVSGKILRKELRERAQREFVADLEINS
jgi:acyl-CoA synthetase (AMP-forming)/AMP-acid ligase II